jgi:hypothetical protein
MNIITTARTALVAAAFGAATLTLTSCGDDLKVPTEDIGGAVLPDPTPRHFEPACNTPAAVRPCPETPKPKSHSTRNRKSDDERASRR